MTEEIAVTKCWMCGYEYDRVTGLTEPDKPARDGDITICINCGAIAIFSAEKRGLREPELKELLSFPEDDRRRIEAIQLHIRLRGRIR
jgi:hypothetical protein